MGNEEYCNTIAKKLYRNLDGQNTRRKMEDNKSIFQYKYETKPYKKLKNF